ncbi:MAG: APC family permease [Coriobacteriia bacterium]|nr:APC family permease [Coriobacteriia bacterium]MCL2871203.1 APC family permease [Coriobacteriia bacterium]
MRKLSIIRRLKHRLLGKPLDSAGIESTKLSWFWGLPQFAGNAVSSVAYAIEEILLVLVPVLGFAAVLLAPNIALPIVILLVVLIFSYAQIIKHYPSGAGAYHVASDTLGKRPAITAASALIVDYILTVAVSISAATAAFTSAFPQFAPYGVLIAVAGVFLVTLLNLRGSQESSRIFGVPTYIFIVLMGTLIITGLFQFATGTLQPLPYASTLPQMDPLIPAAMVFLVLRAFTAGSIALTGIEAVNNSMAQLREPRQKNAQIVLFSLAGIVFFLFVGAIILARILEVVPIIDPATGVPAQGSLTVIAQMGQAIFGTGSLLFFALQIATTLVLFVAANSAYGDLPNLLAALARDGYAPHQFGERGAKLTLSNGIIFLGFAASGLIVAFNASVHALIPLYAVGVFLSFTISQTGMCVRWWRDKERHWKKRMLINVVGAVMTGIALAIMFVAKFSQGAWILALLIPFFSYAMYRVHRHYSEFQQSLAVTRGDFDKHIPVQVTQGMLDCYIPVSSITRATLKNINLANQMTQNTCLLHVSRDLDQEKRLIQQHQDLDLQIPLIILDSPYRDLTTPIVNFLDEEESKLVSGRSIAVITSRFTFNHYYDNILHNQTSYFISRALRDYKDIVVIMVPFHLNLQKIRDSYISKGSSPHRKNRLSKAQKVRKARRKAANQQALHQQADGTPAVIVPQDPAATVDAEAADIRYRRIGYTDVSDTKTEE